MVEVMTWRGPSKDGGPSATVIGRQGPCVDVRNRRDRATATIKRFRIPKIRGGNAWSGLCSRCNLGKFEMTILEIGGQQPKRRGKSNGDARAPVLVTAGALATHLSCVRSYVAKLTDQGVLVRRADGRFDQDVNRARYISHLKEERKRSPRSEADTAFTAAKTRLIELRVKEKERSLIPLDEAVDHMERLIGLFLTNMSGMAARCASDLATRRKIDQVVYETRLAISEAANKLADEAGEPPVQDDAA
ncbi:hypothetical protein [Bradyrhizobium sp.]|uniref:hypothetical protein n=1 Tax=Bradyrhizobium sp. TaxID=376 RepID=UPI003C7E0C51